MQAIEALKKSEVIYWEINEKGEGRRAIVDCNDVLVWNENGEPVSVYAVTNKAWQPYHPEPVKCEACQEAGTIDDLELGKNIRNTGYGYTNHLRKYHCTCKTTI